MLGISKGQHIVFDFGAEGYPTYPAVGGGQNGVVQHIVELAQLDRYSVCKEIMARSR